ncbi:MAG: cytochrome P450 [Variovorax sp.]|nr:MAG: cytochrome P450 [Variovorax sp.]
MLNVRPRAIGLARKSASPECDRPSERRYRSTRRHPDGFRRMRRLRSGAVWCPCPTGLASRELPWVEASMDVNQSDLAATSTRGPSGSASPSIRRYLDVPGPKGVPLLGNAHQVKPESFHLRLEGWAKQFGPLFRFSITSRNFLGVSDPAITASVLKQRPEVFLKGPRLVQVAKDLGFHGVFTANEDAWRRQRQLVLAGLDPAHLKTFLPQIVGVTATLQDRWGKAAREGREIDVMADLMRYTVDVTEVAPEIRTQR